MAATLLPELGSVFCNTWRAIHRADLEKAGFTAKQIGQMADLRPFDPRADNVIWQVHHKIPIQVSGLLKDPNDFKNLVFLPEHEHRAILHSQYLDRQLAGLEPGNRRTVTIVQPIGCISITTGKRFAQQLELSRSRIVDFSAVQLEQVLAHGSEGTQPSFDESVGKMRKGRPPNQPRIRRAMPMSSPGRGRGVWRSAFGVWRCPKTQHRAVPKKGFSATAFSVRAHGKSRNAVLVRTLLCRETPDGTLPE
jgi:hypothetical protein